MRTASLQRRRSELRRHEWKCRDIIPACRVNGQWRTFTGDQLGSLFASHVLDAYKATGKPLSMHHALKATKETDGYAGNLAMVASTVSSKMIEAMARIEGFRFVECLTGNLALSP